MSEKGASGGGDWFDVFVNSIFDFVQKNWLRILLVFFIYLAWKFGREGEVLTLALSVGGVYILAKIAHDLWLHYVRQNFIAGIDWVLLEIIPPRDVVRSPKAMELFITNAMYHFSNKGGLEEYWQGAVWFWYSLEIVSIDGQVHFYINTPTRIRNLIETQMYAQFPQAQIRAVEDYTLAVDEIAGKSGWNMWGCEWRLEKPDVFPIRTYVDFGLDKDPKEEFKVDPITPVIELFGSIGKGEQLWLQIVITPSKQTYGLDKHNWIQEGEEQIKKLLFPFTRLNKSENPNNPLVTEIRNPAYIDPTLKAATNKLLKLGFDTGIRSCYLGKGVAFNANKRRELRLIFRQYAAPYINEFKRINSTQADAFATGFLTSFFMASNKTVNRLKNRMLIEYREREFFHPPLRHSIKLPWPLSPYIFPNYFHPHPIVLNTEELATIWHFPGQILKVPTLERIESKEASPPTNLPT